ncbi:hypothetical protein EBU95_20130 [bacterium]|nr:hypothetical protein [bacterium]
MSKNFWIAYKWTCCRISTYTAAG